MGALIAIAYAALFIKHFTAMLGRDQQESDGIWPEADLKAVHKIVVHAYLLTFLAFFFSIMPFVLFPTFPDLMKYLEGTPIGVLIACQDTTEPLVTACNDSNLAGQWVVNIGGRVELPLKAESVRNDSQELAENNKVHGGFVVPLYLVIVALMGAAVGTARRLPEYQKRGSPAYLRDYKPTASESQPARDPPMPPAQIREAVVFQIMQYMTAPLVAGTSYALIQPNEWQSVVLLGFASGFSTEAVLMLIRQGVDRIAAMGQG